MLEALAGAGRQAGDLTSEAVFRALAEGGQAGRALALYEALEAGGGAVPSPVLNLVRRRARGKGPQESSSGRCAAGGCGKTDRHKKRARPNPSTI
jgi:hypothetical protein